MFKKNIDRLAHREHGFHRILKRRLLFKSGAAYPFESELQFIPYLPADISYHSPKMVFPLIPNQRRIEGAIEGSRSIVFFFGADDIGGAAIAGEQIPAVFRVEKTPQRPDPGYD